MSEPRLRAFVALQLDDTTRARLAQSMEEIRSEVPGVRLVRPEGIHLTLRFLGPSSARQLDDVKPALAAAAAACPALEARTSGLGTFPERGAPRVLWLGLESSPALDALQAACERAARAAGFEPERRPFRPHLTLGRFRERVERRPLPTLDLGETSLRTLVLLRSELQKAGARHTPLETFALAAGRS